MWCGTIFLLFSSFNVYLFFIRKNASRLDAFFKSWLIIWTYILFTTELLSLFHELTGSAVFVSWLILFLFSCYLVKNISRDRFIYAIDLFRKMPYSGLFFVILLVGTFCCGIIYPPNNWDSMTYHLARVSQWIQNQGVQFFDTPIPRQNHQLPLAEYGITHLSLLTGIDRLAFIVQWMSLICAALGVARITELLGGSFKSKWRAMFISASIPMAVFQASSTQNDLVVASFLVIFARFLLDFSPKVFVWTGCAFGLALMTKGTAYIYTFAIGSVLGIFKLLTTQSAQRKKVFGALCLTIVLGISFSCMFFLRNIHYYGVLLFSPATDNYLTASTSPFVLGVNILKHLALHLATPFMKVNYLVTQLFYSCFPEYVNHPAANWQNSCFDIRFMLREDNAANTLHLLLMMFSFAFLLLRRKKVNRITLIYTVMTMCCVVYIGSLLTWNEWLSRLHTTFFLLSVPLMVIVTEQIVFKSIPVAFFLDSIMFLYAALCMFFCNPRPLYPFVAYPAMKFFGKDIPVKRIYSQWIMPLGKGKAIDAICSALPDERPLHIGVLCDGDHRVYYLYRKMNIHAVRNPELRIDFDPDAPWMICVLAHFPENLNDYFIVHKHYPFIL
ncbi:MAG: hypothetical protein IKA22_08975, partial [Lentisphaeria bacterium]|nr:hypothetical protein [Lentisphaeria bacterium]